MDLKILPDSYTFIFVQMLHSNAIPRHILQIQNILWNKVDTHFYAAEFIGPPSFNETYKPNPMTKQFAGIM